MYPLPCIVYTYPKFVIYRNLIRRTIHDESLAREHIEPAQDDPDETADLQNSERKKLKRIFCPRQSSTLREVKAAPWGRKQIFWNISITIRRISEVRDVGVIINYASK